MSRGGDIFCSHCEEDIDLDFSNYIHAYRRGGNIYLHNECLNEYNEKMSKTCIECDEECLTGITVLCFGEKHPVHPECVTRMNRNKLIFTAKLILTAFQDFIRKYGTPAGFKLIEDRFNKMNQCPDTTPQDIEDFISLITEIMTHGT